MTTLSLTHPSYKRIQEIYEKAESVLFKAALVFTNKENEKFSLAVDIIDDIHIIEDFFGSCMAYIEASFKTNVPQYQSLLSNYTELRCNFVLDRYDDEKDIVISNYHNKQYCALIHDMKDVRQTIPNNELYDKENPDKDLDYRKRSQMVNIRVQLIPHSSYVLLKKQFSTTLKNATVAQAIWLFIESMKVKKGYVYPPDNKKTYGAIEIPPFQNINTFIGFLQNNPRYGVYNYGAGMYFDNDAIYTYPSLAIEGKSTGTFHIYKTPPGYLLGAKGTTIFEGEDIIMFSNQITKHNLTAIKTLEQEGNSIFTINRDDVVDNWVNHSEGKSSIQGDKPMVYNSSFGSGITKQSHSPTWHPNANNEQFINTKLASLNVSVLELGWTAALPFVIKPFQKIVYHYESGEKQKTSSCSCPVITYAFKKESRVQAGYFSCFAQIKLFTKESTGDII